MTSPTLATRAQQARTHGKKLASLSGEVRSALLRDLALALESKEEQAGILSANQEDMRDAEQAHAEEKLALPPVRRLEITSGKLASLSDGLKQLADAPEYLNQRQVHRRLDEGLILERRSCPLGVLGVVFEARPDAVPQITGLALKSGNAVLLKGGREALRSNKALVAVIHRVLQEHGIDPSVVQLLEDRKQFAALFELDRDIDLIIARGSTAFVHHVQESTSIPVMGHAEGLCHLYIHRDAKPEMAARIAVDAKCNYPAACNSIETLLWHDEAELGLRTALKALLNEGVSLRLCAATLSALDADHDFEKNDSIVTAEEADWSQEYSDRILAVRRVSSLEEALAHIDHYGSKHTEVILTEDSAAVDRFFEGVDAASVFHNVSSRFADGYRYGLGAEVGISTGKLHARGPVGVEGLLTYRWLLKGEGQAAGDYGPGGKTFLHQELKS